MDGETGKIINNNGTYYVKMLKSWVEKKGLKEGDTVLICETPQGLLIKTMGEVMEKVNGSS